MSKAIEKSIFKALEEFGEGNIEWSLHHLFPAMDVISKKRFPPQRSPKEKFTQNNQRMISFLEDMEAMIFFLATRNVHFVDDILPGGKTQTTPTFLYKAARCALVHDAELDGELTFEDRELQIGGKLGWNLPPSFALSMIQATLMARENAAIKSTTPHRFKFYQIEYRFDDLWGAEDYFKAKMLVEQGVDLNIKRENLFCR